MNKKYMLAWTRITNVSYGYGEEIEYFEDYDKAAKRYLELTDLVNRDIFGTIEFFEIVETTKPKREISFHLKQ